MGLEGKNRSKSEKGRGVLGKGGWRRHNNVADIIMEKREPEVCPGLGWGVSLRRVDNVRGGEVIEEGWVVRDWGGGTYAFRSLGVEERTGAPGKY